MRAGRWASSAFAAIVTVTSAPASAQVVGAESAAQLRFQRGRELFVARDHRGALDEFRAANQLVASPNTRLYIARCLRELGQWAESLVEFQRAAAEAADRAQSEPRYGATRDAARQELELVRPRVGSLTLRAPHAPEGLEVRVGETVVQTATFDVAMPTNPGTLEVRATAPGRLPYRGAAVVQAGGSTELSIELRVDPAYVPPPSREGSGGSNGVLRGAGERAPLDEPMRVPPRSVRVVEGGGVRIGGFVVTALGLGGLGAFVGFGSLASSRFTDLRTVCAPMGGCGPELEGQLQEGIQYQTLANVGLIAGGIALVGGVIMIAAGGAHERVVTEGDPASARQAAASRARRRWTGFLAPRPDGTTLEVGGAF
jgi:hypothetical protein